jgi:hypothetical protein
MPPPRHTDAPREDVVPIRSLVSPHRPCHRERTARGDHAERVCYAAQAGMGQLGRCAAGPGQKLEVVSHSAAQHCAPGFFYLFLFSFVFPEIVATF